MIIYALDLLYVHVFWSLYHVCVVKFTIWMAHQIIYVKYVKSAVSLPPWVADPYCDINYSLIVSSDTGTTVLAK